MNRVVSPVVMLAISVYMEARGESPLGRLGVAYSHVNRAKDARGRWPTNVIDVALQAYQYSWTNPKDPNRQKIDEIDWDDPAFGGALIAAAQAFYGVVPDPTAGANHYFHPKVVVPPPAWHDPAKVTAKIGGHVFLKL